MGEKSFVCCYTKLHADSVHYAGFPDGIPEGMPFGTFFGRQCQHFLTDMGFDYLWLSNGFGFGMETWSTTGAVFDGKDFDVTRFDDAEGKNPRVLAAVSRRVPGLSHRNARDEPFSRD